MAIAARFARNARRKDYPSADGHFRARCVSLIFNDYAGDIRTENVRRITTAQFLGDFGPIASRVDIEIVDSARLGLHEDIGSI